MNIQYFVPTFQRPKILAHSVNTLINNAHRPPDALWVFDDGSDKEIKRQLLEFSFTTPFPTNILFHGKNLGVGWNFENIYNAIFQHEPDIAVIAESDYIWRKGWLEDVLAVFEASPHTLSIAGVSHPDMEDREKTHGQFPKLMIDQFGSDLLARDHLYKSFILHTSVGDIKVRGVSNSCGCLILNFKRLKEVFNYAKAYPSLGGKYLYSKEIYLANLDRAFHKNGTGSRRFASDAHMSGVISMFAERVMLDKGVDISTNFGMLDIEDFSISQHICGGETSINGKIVPEGSTFIVSKSWNDEFINKNPRVKN